MTRSHTDLIATAVQRAGRGRAWFGFAELRREVAILNGSVPLASITLQRGLRALTPTLIMPVPPGVLIVADQNEIVKSSRRWGSARYRLVEQVADPVNPAFLDDAGRVLVALYVASGLAGMPYVTTKLVTDVLHIESTLALETTQKTSILLERLAREFPALVDRDRGHTRTVLWGAVGVLREEWRQRIEGWAEQYGSRLVQSRRLAQEGARSAGELAARLVELVEQRARDAEWPRGRPVSLRRITDEISIARCAVVPSEADQHLVRLAEILQRRERDLGESVRTACRDTYSNGARARAPQLYAIRVVGQEDTAYGSASLPSTVRDAWPMWRKLQARCHRDEFRRIDRERTAIRALRAEREPALQALAAAREALVVRELASTRALVAAMVPLASTISSALEERRRRLHDAVEGVVAHWPSTASVESTARTLARAFGRSINAVCDIPRPTISIAQFAALMPAFKRGRLSDGVLAANAITVRKVPDPQGRRAAVGRGRTPKYRLDRVDALEYLVENSGFPGRRLFVAGARLLGPWLADTALLRLLLDHSSEDVRNGALGAALLLGDTGLVERTLRRRERSDLTMTTLDADAVNAARWWLERLAQSTAGSASAGSSRIGAVRSA